MLDKPTTFRALIDRIGGVAVFASATGINEHSAKKMRDRNSIAVKHWPVVIEVAKQRAALLLTTDDLVSMNLKGSSSKSRDGARPKKMAANPKVAAGAI